MFPQKDKNQRCCESNNLSSLLSMELKIRSTARGKTLESSVRDLVRAGLPTAEGRGWFPIRGGRSKIMVTRCSKGFLPEEGELFMLRPWGIWSWTYFGLNGLCLFKLVTSETCNFHTYPAFMLFRDLRQGCPLFPCILKPLAIAIRKNASLKGLTVGNGLYKAFYYAGNLLSLQRTAVDPENWSIRWR